MTHSEKTHQPIHAFLLCALSAIIVLSASGCGKKDAAPETADSPRDSAPEPVASVQEGSGEGSGMAPAVGGDTSKPAGPVVTVNGVPLQRAELDMRVSQTLSAPQYAQLPPQLREQLSGKVAQDVIEQFITRELLKNEAARQQIPVAESNVTAAIEQIKKGLPPEMTLEQALARSGSSIDKLRTGLTEELGMRQLLNERIASTPEPTDDEIASYYGENSKRFEEGETVSARHILVKCEAGADEAVKTEKRKTAEGYRKQLLEGADFAELARNHSEGPSGPKGGDLGSFGRGQMVPPFDAAAFAQEVDAIGEIVETQFGYHIVQVLARNEARTRTLEDARGEIGELLTGQRREAAFMAYIDELKSKAEITYATPPAAQAPALEGSGS